MPWAATEAISDKKGADRNRDCECHKRANCADGEDGANRDLTSEDQKDTTTSNEDVEPDGIDGCLCVFVDAGPVAGAREASVTGVRESDTGSGNHASLTHREGGDDRKAETGEGGIFAETLEKESCPGLTEI